MTNALDKLKAEIREERYWDLVFYEPTSGCWLWGGTCRNGYGNYWSGKKSYPAHRVAVLLDGRDIPEGMVIDHLCRNKMCVNPQHLEVVTNRENILRGIGPTSVNAHKEYCVSGHPFTQENTLVRKNGKRKCRQCHRELEMRRCNTIPGLREHRKACAKARRTAAKNGLKEA